MRKPKYHEPTRAENIWLAIQFLALVLTTTFFFRGLMWALEQGAWS